MTCTRLGNACIAAILVLGPAVIARVVSTREASTAPARTLVGDPTSMALDSATLPISATLTSRAVAMLAAGDPRARLLVVLRGRDRLNCEDLGRQLRELQRASGPDRQAVIVTENAATDGYRAYGRREHLRMPVLGLSADSLLVTPSRLPTPAVLV